MTESAWEKARNERAQWSVEAPNDAPPRNVSRWFSFTLFVLGALVFAGVVVGAALFVSATLAPPDEAALYAGPLAGTGGEASAVAPAVARTETQVRVFFTPDGVRLSPQTMRVPARLTEQGRLRFALEELTHGPPPGEGELVSPIPPGTRLLGAYVTGRTAVVDLSGEVLQALGGLTAETLCVYAVVDTVVENAPSVEAVRILVDGRTRRTLWADVDLTAPLAPDLSLVVY